MYWAFPREMKEEVELFLAKRCRDAPLWISRGPLKPRGPWMIAFCSRQDEVNFMIGVKFGLEFQLS
jgi:hypothetical protein